MEMQSGLDYLGAAGNMIEKYEISDFTAPTFFEITGINQHGMATGSGLNDYDYQDISVLSKGVVLNQLTTINKIPIPSEIMEHFQNIKCHCMMGLFPEIGRAWLTIDSDIYIWTYEKSRDIAYFDGLNQLIVGVNLIVPKPGVFISDIKHLLVLTTPVEIVVLGLMFGQTDKTMSSTGSIFDEMQLMNKPIFVMNTDNVAITCIEGSADGRIFMGGRDGCLYEIAYQAESDWFGKRCKKINHSQGFMSLIVPGFLKSNDAITKILIDNSKNLLYCLTEQGTVEAWKIETNSMKKIAKITMSEMASLAGNILRTVDTSVFKPVVSLCCPKEDDSPNIHMVAVTLCGVRFYFSTVPLMLGQQNLMHQEQNVSQGLYLLHVRMPPGYTVNPLVGKPKQVHSTLYCQGSILMVSTPQQDQDLLWSISSEPFSAVRQSFTESSATMLLDGHVWALAEYKEKQKTTVKSYLKDAISSCKVILLTNQGVHIVALAKPVTLLQQVLQACHGPHHEAVKAYFKSQTEHQACCSSLLLACSDTFRGTDVYMWAIEAFFLYGGEPYFSAVDNSNMRNMFMSPPFANSTEIQQNTMQQYQYSPGTPTNFNGSFNRMPANDVANVNFSAKHIALYLHVCRTLRPLWRFRCVNNKFVSSITQLDCGQILDELYAMKEFLEDHNIAGMSKMQNHINEAVGHQKPNASLQRNPSEDAHLEESKSLYSLIFFIKHTCEVMSLWKILCEHQLNVLVQEIPKEHQNSLFGCAFRDLILYRKDLCVLLIIALINTYLKDNGCVDAISSKLRDVCPNLYRHEDAVSHKATELVLMSKSCSDDEEKEVKLLTALQLCKSAAPNLPLNNICQQFTTVGFYQGVIELCVTVASKIDPTGAGLHFYKNNNEPGEDQMGFMAYDNRTKCYNEVKKSLDYIYQTVCNAENHSDSPTAVSITTRKVINNEILDVVLLALQTQDQLLHVAVYEFLLSHKLLGELLGITEKSLGEFLRRSASRNPQNLQLVDLLWKYYERNNEHAEAAKILDDLASKPNDDIPLVKRIEYLARGVMCIRSDTVGFSAQNGVFLKDLEDKLEIARIQKKILDIVSTLDEGASLEAKMAKNSSIANLNSTLFNMTQLYTDFAERFDLAECKLQILNCSHHKNSLLVESVWKQILDDDTSGATSKEKWNLILSKVKNLAYEYGNSSHCFPIPFIVRELERKCLRMYIQGNPVPKALVEMNIDVDILLEVYARLISMNERVEAENDELYLVKSTSKLLVLLTSQQNLLTIKNRRRVAAKAQELVSLCLNYLFTKPDTESLVLVLRECENKLQRLG